MCRSSAIRRRYHHEQRGFVRGLPGAAAGRSCCSRFGEPQPGCPAAQPEALTAFQPAAIELQAEHMLATADAMFREMIAEMNAMQAQTAALMQAPIPGPQQLTEATFGPGYSVPPRPWISDAYTTIPRVNPQTDQRKSPERRRTNANRLPRLRHQHLRPCPQPPCQLVQVLGTRLDQHQRVAVLVRIHTRRASIPASRRSPAARGR